MGQATVRRGRCKDLNRVMPRHPTPWDESRESPPGAEMRQAARPDVVQKAPGGAVLMCAQAPTLERPGAA
jgi:hypothetical protein